MADRCGFAVVPQAPSIKGGMYVTEGVAGLDAEELVPLASVEGEIGGDWCGESHGMVTILGSSTTKE